MLRRIVAFTLAVEDLDRSVNAYTDALGYRLLDEGRVDAALARRWSAPRCAGARWARVGTADAADATLRFVEQPRVPDYDAARSLGWAAVEIAVQDPYALATRLAGGPFRVVVPPRALPFDAEFHAMQVLGPDDELLYLTRLPTTRRAFDLTPAQHAVDRAFIAVLASADLRTSLDWYSRTLATPARDFGATVIRIINERHGLAAEASTRLGLVKLPQEFLIEVDQMPATAVERRGLPGWLPPGIALLSCEDDAVGSPQLVRGPSGEWLERLPAGRL